MIDPPNKSTNGEASHVRKRKRTTLSCLQCVRRRAKCDKSHPCSTCVSRKEAHLCEYESGVIPMPAEASVSMQEFLALKQRLDKLEHTPPKPPAISPVGSGSNHGNTPQSRTRTDGPSPTYGSSTSMDCSNIETALRGFETIAVGKMSSGVMDKVRDRSSITSSTNDSEPVKWPCVVLPASNLSKRSSIWLNNMGEVFSRLPDAPTIKFLVDYYYKETVLPHVMQKVFELELVEFENVRRSGDSLLLDPAWLALLLAILWCALFSITENQSEGSPSQGYEMLTPLITDAFDVALACAEWIGKPQIRILQALVVTMPPHGPVPFTDRDVQHSGTAFRLMWLDVCISICTTLRLHILGSDQPLPDDIALPKHLPALARQMCAMSFAYLFTIDTLLVGGYTDIKSVSPFALLEGSYDTAAPLNYREEDLISMRDPQPQQKFELTTVTNVIYILELSKLWRKIIIAMQQPETFTYDRLLELDREMRIAINHVENLSTVRELTTKGMTVYDALYSSHLFRLLRLHRVFYLQSFENPAFHFTQVTIVDAARKVTKVNRRLLMRHSRLPATPHSLYMCIHHLAALVVLFVQAVMDPESKKEMREEIKLSLDALGMHYPVNKPYHTRIGGKSIRIVNLLLQALDADVTPNSLEDVLHDILSKSQSEQQELSKPMVLQQADTYLQSPELENLLRSWTMQLPGGMTPTVENADVDVDWNSLFRGF